MAGRPLTRARREREAQALTARRATGRATFDPATRDAAIQRAKAIGDRKAAQEVGCSEATIRSWRARAKAGPAPSRSKPPAGELADPESLAEHARRARQAERRALLRVDELLRAGRAHESRSASQVARDHAWRAGLLEAEARHHREHLARMAESEAKLSESEARLTEKPLRLAFVALGLGWGSEQQALWGALLVAFAQAEPVEDGGRVRVTIPEPEAAAAREAVLRHLGAELRQGVEQQAELEPPPADHEQAQHAPKAGAKPVGAIEARHAEPPAGVVDPGAGVGWDDLDESWKACYRDDPALGVWEFAQALRREEADRQDRPDPLRRESPWSRERFTHPGLRGVEW